MNFSLTAKQQAKITEWLHTEVYPHYVALQKESGQYDYIFTNKDGVEFPYEGAIGGSLTYEFTPTGLGLCVNARYREMKIDVTDYDTW